MRLDNLTSQIYVVTINEARLHGHEYVTPEHFLYSMLLFDDSKDLIRANDGDIENILNDLTEFFEEQMPQTTTEQPMESYAFSQMMEFAAHTARIEKKESIGIAEFLRAIFLLQESFAQYILSKNGVKKNIPFKTQPVKQSVKKNQQMENYTVDLIELAQNNKLDPLVGREDVLERTIHVLCRRLKNNPVHVGDPGVGKTAIVEGLAQRIATGDVPQSLKDVQLLRIDMGSLVAGTRYRGDFEERLVKLMEGIAALGNRPIVYIDEIHTVVGTGAVSGSSMDATNIIKPYLSRGEIRFIGSTTHDEYKKHFEKDRALARRFAKIDISEPSQDECLEILKGLQAHYEDFHGVVYTDDILKQIVSLSAKHMNDRFLPDKAIDVMDEAGVYTNLNLIERDVTPLAVERVIANMAKVPEKSVTANETVALKNLEADLSARVFGQENAIKIITHAIHSARAGLNEPERPVANLLFVGPTGVGKTEVTKQLAELMGIQLTRFDMSEYQEKHAVARLIGAPPGYVGYEEGGLMTDAIRRTPHCVLLLDEIEKAHPDILNILLQVMDYGVLTDNTGKKADFRNTIIIMTSNAGAREMTRQVIGFDGSRDDSAASKAVEKAFSPEFRNRLDAIVQFKGVDKAMALRIAQKSLDKLGQKLLARGVKFSANSEALEFIATKGLSETYGAREIIRLVENDVKKLLVNEVLFGTLANGGNCELVLVDGVLVVRN